MSAYGVSAHSGFGFSRRQDFTLKVETKQRPPAEFKRELVMAAPPKEKEKPPTDKGKGKKGALGRPKEGQE